MLEFNLMRIAGVESSKISPMLLSDFEGHPPNPYSSSPLSSPIFGTKYVTQAENLDTCLLRYMQITYNWNVLNS